MKFPKTLDLFSLRPEKKESRFAWIDYAKGVAIVLVVYRHIAYGLIARGVSLPHAILATNDMLYSFRMPLFFLLSGVFFSKSVTKRGVRNFIFLKVNTLLYPYLLWAIIQISLQIAFSRFTNSERSGSDFLNIFLQPRTLDQLWYLFALFNVTMLYTIVSQITGNKKLWQLLTGLILLGIAPYVQSHSTLYDITLHYIFFAIGDTAANYFLQEQTQKELAKPKYLLMVAPGFALLQWYYLYHQQMNLYLFMLIALNGCLFVILLSSWLASVRKLEFLNVIGHYSLYVYLLHVSIFACMRAVLLSLGVDNGVVLLLILIPSSIFVSIIVYRICVQLKLTFLFTGKFGEHRGEKKSTAVNLI
ncbi:MAG: acyltransferase [Chitinophaga sp.]|uniref:acyltransferase family protein n=1 Tax=Chitinophaga sp. TaxID=1869181 RepID=UPI001B1289BB|nr:acyltransferase [Chitinophaga sp.]MBO9730968.1 acyltransferase [Chitinophaga sp.]